MHVLHIIPNTATDRGGLDFAAAETIASEARQGNNNIHVAVLKSDGDLDNTLSRKLASCGTTLHRLEDGGDKKRQLQEVFRRAKPDVAVLWYPDPQAIAYLETQNIPVVFRASTTYDYRGMMPEEIQAREDCFRFIKKHNGLVVCNSDTTQQWHTKHFDLPARFQKTVLEGIALEDNPTSSQTPITRASLGISEDAYVVANNTRVTSNRGSFNYNKDPFGFILMASHLSQHYPKAVFVMCGNGAQWNSRTVRLLIKKANAMTGGTLAYENFRALGHVENPDDIYKLSDIGVSTSQSEGFGRTVVEAMKHGRPTIVTDTGIMPQMNGDIAHVIPVRSFSYDSEEAYYGKPEDNRTWLALVEKQFRSLYERTPRVIAADSDYLRTRAASQYDINPVARAYLKIYSELAATHKAKAEYGISKDVIAGYGRV